MATSLTPGKTSSALSKLAELSSQSSIRKLFTALNNDSSLHIVGGAVRDAILNKEIKDIDLTTKLRPEDVSSALAKAGIRWEPTGIEHGTILAVVDEEPIEITTFRRAGAARIETGPKIFSETIEEDLAGRDFTINALAFNILSQSIVDPFGGLADLEHKIIKCVGDPIARFKEDPLRILRMARFGPALGRTIDQKTFKAATQTKDQIKSVSQERIRDEFIKIICNQFPGNALRELRQIGALDIILPEIIPSYDFEQNDFHRFDVFEHTLAVLDNAPSSPLLRLSAVFHDLGKPATLSVGEDGRRHFYKHEIESTHLTKQALKRLRCSNKLIHDVSLLVRYHMRPLNCGPAAVRRLIKDLGPLLEPWMEFKVADSLGAKVTPSDINAAIGNFKKMLEEQLKKGDFLTLAIDGDDLKQLGVSEGPIIGNIINSLRDIVIAEPANNTREYLLTLVKEKFISSE
jgi:tRNA nucleotidyltransferase (CCA-adding enzyme)